MDKIDLNKELDKLNKLSEKEVDEIFKSINRIIYYLIKHITTKSSAKNVDRLFQLLRKCFSCFNKHTIVGKGWVKCARKLYRVFLFNF